MVKEHNAPCLFEENQLTWNSSAKQVVYQVNFNDKEQYSFKKFLNAISFVSKVHEQI